MGSIEGFIKQDRQLPDARDPKERIKDYNEFYQPHEDSLTVQQASRCMDCGVPFCHHGCPLGNFIPEFNDAVYHEEWERAVAILQATNNFPEFTGRICPAPCEESCVLGINKPAVAIEHIEKSIAEKGFKLGLMGPHPPEKRTGKKLAVIGSGPAGLAAADQLNKAGFTVDVFEKDPKPGGLLTFGIPDFKLGKDIVHRRIEIMEAEGVNFITHCEAGVDKSISDLKAYDAILLTIGATIPRDLPIEGRDLDGVHFAMDFLTQQNKRISGLDFTEPDILATGKNVVVIGGGDTGSDCIGTSNRQQARSVTQLEIMGKPPADRAAHNPWPEWPFILRTSSSHEEGAAREWSVKTKAFCGENGKLTGLKTVKVAWENGRLSELPGTEDIIPCDLALLAMGFTQPAHGSLLDQLNVSVDGRGNIEATNFQTRRRGVFAAGDSRRGQSLVVWAIAEGRQAAKAIQDYLGVNPPLHSEEVSVHSL